MAPYSGEVPEVAAPPSHTDSAPPLLSVMIIDDQQIIRRILSEAFASAGIGCCCQASDGLEAMTWLHTPDAQLPDLIVTDLHMDGMDGLGVLQSLRLSKRRDLRMIPVIVLTGEDDETLCSIAIEMGSRAVLHKPISKSDLLAAASRAMGVQISAMN